jgi:hypothetical protein
MALLQAILEKNIQLFDYEVIAEDVKDANTGKIKKRRECIVGYISYIAKVMVPHSSLISTIQAS